MYESKKNIWDNKMKNCANQIMSIAQGNIYLFKVNNRNIKKGANFEYTLHLFLVFLLFILNR